MKQAIAVTALLLGTVPAIAADRADRGHGFFFNRPGATLESQLAAQAACVAIAEGTAGNLAVAPVPNLAGILTAGILSGITTGRQRQTNVENCMLIRGWRLFALTGEDKKAWRALAEPERKTLLDRLVGAEMPENGQLIRVWHNDYAEPGL